MGNRSEQIHPAEILAGMAPALKASCVLLPGVPVVGHPQVMARLHVSTALKSVHILSGPVRTPCPAERPPAWPADPLPCALAAGMEYTRLGSLVSCCKRGVAG